MGNVNVDIFLHAIALVDTICSLLFFLRINNCDMRVTFLLFVRHRDHYPHARVVNVKINQTTFIYLSRNTVLNLACGKILF